MFLRTYLHVFMHAFLHECLNEFLHENSLKTRIREYLHVFFLRLIRRLSLNYHSVITNSAIPPTQYRQCVSLTPGHVQLDAPMRDLVRKVGETVRLMCEISGHPVPQYIWAKDGVDVKDLRGIKARYRIKTTAWGSRSVP